MGRTNEKLWESAKAEAKSKMGGKHCSVCKEYKPLEDFTSNKSQLSGKMGYCKACNSERNKKYRQDTKSLPRACKRVYGYLSRRVREKNLELDFEASYLEELYRIQKGLCAYTKEKLEIASGRHNTLSVDRIDSSKGYTKDNVCLTTWRVNNCKQDLSLFDFVELCKKVVQNVPYE